MTTKTFQAKIRFSRRAIVWFALAAAVVPPVAGQSTTNERPPVMDRQKEIALALSACPPSVARKAAVYVLDRAGYIKVRDSENGFTAIVQHAVPTSQDPQCMDAEGGRTFLPRYLKVAQWRAEGKNADEIKLLVADAFAKGIFPAADQTGHQLYAFHREPYTQRERRGHTLPAARDVLCAVLDERGSRFGRPARSRRKSGWPGVRRGGRHSACADHCSRLCGRES